MKILVSAYACEPGKGSEPEVGWQWVRQIARFHETWVITRTNNRENIEKGLRENPIANLHFVYIDLPKWARFWKKGNRGVHIYHQLWQYQAVRTAFHLHQFHKFDLCHHITFGVVWHPSYFYRLPTKFIWGPFGGGECAYEPIVKHLPLTFRAVEILRKKMGQYYFNFDPSVRKCLTKAAKLIVKTDMTAKMIPSEYSHKVKIMLETGFDNVLANSFKNFSGKNLCLISRLIPLKNIELAIKSMKIITRKIPDAKLNIFGDGYLMLSLKKLASDLGVDNNILFHGNVNHGELLNILNDMDILLHPSIRDGGTHSVMEALSKGVPVICLDNAGPAYMVDQNSGVKITGDNPIEIMERFADAAIDLLENKDKWERLSTGAKERVVNHFLWDNIGERLNAIYEEVLR